MLMEALQGLSLDSVSTHRHRLKGHPYKGRRMRWEHDIFVDALSERKCRVTASVREGGRGGREGAQVSHTDQISAARDTLHLLGDLGRVT